ncbi:MAG TPA: YggT family protein [Candidatus Cloacimonadota bacterium]|nr:YggT family protein [Candidatus Cloacimonadota bacterium]HPT71015.1 YggT family protein [Candidatus Cloacimonadota bacterium]
MSVLLRFLVAVLNVYEIVIIVRAVMSWFNPDPYNPIVRFLSDITDPVMNPIRRIIPMPGIDFSPMIVILIIEVIKRFLYQ